MVDLDILLAEDGKGVYARVNGENVYPAYIKPISAFYRVEAREGCEFSHKVPFNSVHYEKGGILLVDDPKYEKRANKKIARLVLGGK